MRVLIVEDEVKIRRGMANLIENHTEHVVVGEARNGREGLEMIRRYLPDLVLSDIRMPVMDGLDMLEEMRKAGIDTHMVILSGYSEFDYAKKAIRYGVDDYLIKPLAPEDVIRLLEEIQDKLAREVRVIQGTPEKKLRDIFLGNAEDGMEAGKLRLLCGFEEEKYHLITAYTGNEMAEERRECRERFEKLNRDLGSGKIHFFFIDNTKEFIALMEEGSWQRVRTALEEKLLCHPLHSLGWIWTERMVEDLQKLAESYRLQREWYSYGMVFGSRLFLNEDALAGFVPEELIYPRKLEHQMQMAILGEKPEELTAAARQFRKALTERKSSPAAIKEAYLRLLDFLLSVSKERSRSLHEQMQSLNVIQRAGFTVTRQELEDILDEVCRTIASGICYREDISNYTIKRAIHYIRNHYQESISLEIVANELDITPEYLSTLFNREVEVNFSSFLKQFRISHAKRLLRGTDKKIYEIAAEVGYADAKYFNRVFKEEEGISPGDYRSLH